MVTEIEIRSFISQEQYDSLLERFGKEGELVKIEDDETEYYAEQGAVRLWSSKEAAKIILKSGNIHDEHREEHEIHVAKEDYTYLQDMFKRLSIPKQVKWKRKRYTFKWGGITVQLGDNKGYGYIIELEQLAETEDKEKVVALLKEKLASLDIALTPKEVFEEKYDHYKNNWQTLLES